MFHVSLLFTVHVSCVNLLYISNAIVKHNCVHKIGGVIKFLAIIKEWLVDKVWETLPRLISINCVF